MAFGSCSCASTGTSMVARPFCYFAAECFRTRNDLNTVDDSDFKNMNSREGVPGRDL